MPTETIKVPTVGRQVFAPHGGRQQRPGIVIGAVAVTAVGDRMVGMLQDAGIVSEGFEMIELDLREFESRNGLDMRHVGVPWTGPCAPVELNIFEQLEILV